MCSAVIKGAVADIGHRPYGLACGEVVRFILSSYAGEDCSRVELARSRADVSLGSGSANRQQFGMGMFGFGPNDRLSCSAGWCIYNALSARSAL